jgi:hypothetical protein
MVVLDVHQVLVSFAARHHPTLAVTRLHRKDDGAGAYAACDIQYGDGRGPDNHGTTFAGMDTLVQPENTTKRNGGPRALRDRTLARAGLCCLAAVAVTVAAVSAVTSQVLAAVKNLEQTATLRGLILDLRGNGGGLGSEVGQLLGAFEHGIPYAYDCAVTGSCTADYPDASTPLLHLPLALLTDRNCASGCDTFSEAVKDLHLGTLIGTRTAGIVAGPATGWTLDDGSQLALPAEHQLGADHELVNGIGVAAGYYIPLTALDLATGHDPDIAKALAVL